MLPPEAVKLAGSDSGKGILVDGLPDVVTIIEGLEIGVGHFRKKDLNCARAAWGWTLGYWRRDTRKIAGLDEACPILNDAVFRTEQNSLGEKLRGDQLAEGRGTLLVVVNVEVKSDGDLPEIRGGDSFAPFALRIPEGGADERSEHTDNGDDREEFNESEPPRPRRVFRRKFQLLQCCRRSLNRNVENAIPTHRQPHAAAERAICSIEEHAVTHAGVAGADKS